MRKLSFEWVVEEMDEVSEEIVDTSAYSTFGVARYWADVARQLGLIAAICLRRDIGEGPDLEHLDIVDRQHAYPGETKFCGGAAIPRHLLAQLNSLEPVS